MGLFKTKQEKELDRIIEKLHMNMSNNYKDTAQENFRLLEETFQKCINDGGMKDAVRAKYEGILDDYRERLQGYTHKDQKPYWH